MRIDSHQHFWYYQENKFSWMNDSLAILQKNFLPKDIKPLINANEFDGTITVQAEQNIEETLSLLKLADLYPFIKGVVGWVPLCSSDVEKSLTVFAKHPKFVGVRHLVHDEVDDNFMLRPDFQNGIAHLQKFKLTYDLLLFARHLPVAVKLIKAFPQQPFVLDHIAKPPIREAKIGSWAKDIIALAKYPNVFCKLSGMVTEAKWHQWKAADFHPYLDIIIDAFGAERVMIGSDWPVCLLSSDYAPTVNIVKDYIQKFPATIRDKILGENCMHFYGI
jgi:L-fuconolactonase